jgi:hypothetical protein
LGDVAPLSLCLCWVPVKGDFSVKDYSLAPMLCFKLMRLVLLSNDVKAALDGTRPSNYRGHFELLFLLLEGASIVRKHLGNVTERNVEIIDRRRTVITKTKRSITR